MLLVPIVFLLNFVILASKAQQQQPPLPLPLIPPQSSPSQPLFSLNSVSSSNSPNTSLLPQPSLPTEPKPAPPTKPPQNQPIRTTPAASINTTTTATTSTTTTKLEIPSTPSLISPSSVIVIDVSQQPTTVTQSPQVFKPLIQTERPLEAIVENGRSSEQITNSFSSNITKQLDSAEQLMLPTTPSPSLGIQTTQSNSSQISSQGITETTAALSSVTPRPPISRQSESRRLNDGPNLPGASMTTPIYQFLRPKNRCRQNSDCNGGLCSNGTCFCAPGFTGDHCNLNVDECRMHDEPCYNGGKCIDGVNEFKCDCAPGFKGERCSDAVDMCAESPCLNSASCINHRTSYTCQCEPGWEGKHCENDIDECSKNPCKNNATCNDLVNDYRCDCGSSGFTGKNCDVEFDDCATKPCSFGAKECIDLTGDFKCVCHDGWTGKKCDEDINECSPNPCENNGTCIERSQNFQHPHNSTSEHTMYHDIREQNISSSVNMSQYAGFVCDCREEYYGDRCEERKKCYTRSVVELCNHQQAECVNVGNSYECLISASFDGSGQNYAEYRVNGTFTMKEIFVKYRSLTGGIFMSFETNQQDSPVADLQLNKSGLYLSGTPIKRDENINFDQLLDGTEREIRLGLDTPTEIKSITLTRSNVNNDHSPFKGCLLQVRLNNQLVPLLDYDLGMNHSFYLVENHLDIGQCRTCFEKDCLNHGHCELLDSYDRCTCPDTFTGNFCETDVNECERNFNLCANGGYCNNTLGGYRCHCKDGFKGKDCKEISDYCLAKQPCVTGTCKNINAAQGTFQCECPSSHVGKRCERKRDCNECHSHHAHCINNVTCACLPGRREERTMCEYIASCEQVEGELCLNGGTCKNLDSLGGYHCVCQESFQGSVCQFLIEKPRFDVILVVVVTCFGFLVAACSIVCLVVFRSVRRARATRGTYSPSTQEKFGNSASDQLKPPIPERLI